MSVLHIRKNSVATLPDWYGDIHEEHTRSFLQLYLSKIKTCTICCGFYGPNFDQPVCHTCHAFLFPEDINIPDGTFFLQEKSDSEDSGTEEPSDYYDLVSNHREPRLPLVMQSPKSDRLAECISALSCPRKKEIIDEDFLKNFPTEVLVKIFSYLDDLSLWNCSHVCHKWSCVIREGTSQEKWHKFIQKRWPLFHPSCSVHNWKAVYRKLAQSASCLQCLHQMKEQVMRSVPSTNDKKWRSIRLRNEMKVFNSDPPEGIKAVPLDWEGCHWQASITGPADSPYEGGEFFLYLQIPHNYPMRPPVVMFITKIFHPNVSSHGNIGIDSIHDNWSLALTISKILISIQSLLTDPYCHVCMEPELGRLYLENQSLFDATARLWTHRYAMSHVRPSLPNGQITFEKETT